MAYGGEGQRVGGGQQNEKGVDLGERKLDMCGGQIGRRNGEKRRWWVMSGKKSGETGRGERRRDGRGRKGRREAEIVRRGIEKWW